MSTELDDTTIIEPHLEDALEAAENSEAKYQLREALQKLYSIQD